MTQTKTVIQLGNPLLRQRAADVDDVHATEIQSLIASLITTAGNQQGVGIAAPQVAESRRIFIVASRPNLRYPHAPKMEPTAMINPHLLAHGNEQSKDWEGCLSVPGIRGLVPRYREIEVAYLDRWGDEQKQVLTDFVARIFQHELDHLNGRVFLDRVENTLDLMTEDEYQTRVVLA